VAANRKKVWLFDLDNTLHDASHAAFGETNAAMNSYMVEHLAVDDAEAARLRLLYLRRYGATLLGLVRHHGVKASHFLERTHRHPGLEDRVRMSLHDRAAVERLRGRKYVLTNAPLDYSMRVMRTLKLDGLFDGVISIEDMSMFGQLRPKPDARMFRHVAAKLKVKLTDCVLVEDVLANLKTARGIGMQTVWMRRYLEGRYRGHLRGGATSGFNHASARVAKNSTNAGQRKGEVSVHPCPSPCYVCAKIRSLKQLHML
jgi:putative hydrolase of the HAD superfamily